MFFGIFWIIMLVVKVAAIIIGAGTAINCARGLFSGEGMYDRDNTRYMFWMQIAGIVAGIAAVAWGFSSLFGGFFK